MSSILSERLKQAKQLRGLTWREVAERSGFDRTHIYKVMRGQTQRVSVFMVETLAEVLEVNPAWLVGWSDNQVPDDKASQ